MKNYLIFNGINSNTLKGLIISTLPPISKPQMKTRITEIDGCDGDIIDELGYKSYDKTIEIGLSYGYDIDKIIKFFSGSGEMVFSNEPDKIYQVQIYSQVNYEKLLYFKKAKIKIHVQPYKYKYNESAIVQEITDNITSVLVENMGLEQSKPIITVYGTGTITLVVNGMNCCILTMDDNPVIIDSIKQEAYFDNILKNRLMKGEFPILNPGENEITWVGNLTKIEIQPKSRWL